MSTYRLMPLMRQGQEEEGLLFGVCVGVCQSLGLMFTYRLMPLMRQGQEEGDCCFGVCRGMPEEGLMFNLPPDAPSCDRGRRRGIAVWGCVGGYARGGRAVTVKARRRQGLP